jgi:ABC-type multidrug transport system fused ATPase/permease subunit
MKEEYTLKKLDNIGLTLLFILIVQGFFSFGRVFMFTRVTESLLESLRNKAFERLIKKPMSFFSKNQSGELSSRLATDLNVISEAFTMNIAEVIRQSIVGIGGLEYASPDAPKLVDRSAMGRLKAVGSGALPFQIQAGFSAPEGEGAKRAALGTLGFPVYGATPEQRKAARAEREKLLKKQAREYHEKAKRKGWEK